MAEVGTTGRREPPRFRRLRLVAKAQLGPRMIRVTLGGDELDGFVISDPAASVRLLLPPRGADDLVMPEWNGNEFLMSDGTRPIIRTFTPRTLSSDGLVIDMVIHDGGAAAAWAGAVDRDAPAAISGPGRGYTPDKTTSHLVLAGDETAIPAIAQLLETLPMEITIEAHLEVRPAFGRIEMPFRPDASLVWHERADDAAVGSQLLAAIRSCRLGDKTEIWCAGEAAGMHAIRTYLFTNQGVPRARTTVRGYWKLRES